MTNNSKASLKMPLFLWALTTSFFAFQFILRMSAGILRESIMQKFNLDTIAFGSVAGYYYLGYSSMQIPVGIMLDRYNFKYVTAGAIFIAMVGTLTFVFSSNVESVIFGRFLIGVGSAAGILSVAKIIQLYFPPRLHAIMMGFTFSLGLTGAVFGGLPMKVIFNEVGYNTSFISLAIVASVIALAILFVRDKNVARNEHIEEGKNLSLYEIIKLVLNPTILFIGVCGGFMVGSLEGFADVWAMPFFNQIYGFSENQSIFLATTVFTGMIFGGPLLGYFERLFGSVSFMIFATAIVTSVIFCSLFYFGSMSYAISLSLMFFMGVLCCYQVLVFTMVGDMVGKSETAIAVSIINCINMSFGQLFHKFISYIMQSGWDGSLNANGGPVYTHQGYVVGLSIIPIFAVIGGVGFLYLAIKHKKRK
ncbi:MAG: MFS transporter [Rickettsiaceae bacterium]|nr:MFS transporter [Rickettsiaceae bacterium]